MQPRILTRSQHTLSRKQIDPDPLRVLYRLKSAGFKGYLVGGGVRDLLLGRKPKDFDIATDASPPQVKKLFRNCFVVGRRFRLCHVRFGRKVVEVSTFRRPTTKQFRKSFFTCWGWASVAMSKSLGLRSSSRSRTPPPTR